MDGAGVDVAAICPGWKPVCQPLECRDGERIVGALGECDGGRVVLIPGERGLQRRPLEPEACVPQLESLVEASPLVVGQREVRAVRGGGQETDEAPCRCALRDRVAL